MRSFITGSYAYGAPRVDSDVDLVVLISRLDRDLLLTINECKNDFVLRFGKLNIIPCLEENVFAAWKFATLSLVLIKETEGRPIGREEAKERIDRFFDESGLSRYKDSPSDPLTSTGGKS